jgi:hypothetical protein
MPVSSFRSCSLGRVNQQLHKLVYRTQRATHLVTPLSPSNHSKGTLVTGYWLLVTSGSELVFYILKHCGADFLFVIKISLHIVGSYELKIVVCYNG